MLDRAGITGDDGPSHNGIWDLALTGIVPTLHVAAPRDGQQLRETLREAINISDAPSLIRFPKGSINPDIPAFERRDGIDVLYRCKWFTNGRSGGSGSGAAGASGTSSSVGTGTANQGYNGGTTSANHAGGGGGGAGAVGANASGTDGGNGGNGVVSTITGSSVTRGGGGGGGAGYRAMGES